MGPPIDFVQRLCRTFGKVPGARVPAEVFAPGRSTVMALALLAAGTQPVAGQSGVPGGDPASGDRMRAEFYAHVLSATDSVFARWSEAWRREEGRRAASLYAGNAVLVLPDGSPVVGRDAIEPLLVTALPRLGRIQAGRSDFAASERMGYLAGAARFEVGDMEGARSPVRGSHATVLLRTEEGWRIRFQLFRVDAGQETVPLRTSGAARDRARPIRPDEVVRSRSGPSREYYERTYAAVSRAVGDLATALQDGNLRRVAELYGDDARLASPLGDRMLSGRSAVVGHLPELASGEGQVHMALLDFDASGRMAVVYGRYLIQGARGAGGGDLVGPYLLVFTLGDDEPRIRAHWMGRDGG